jgi:hypothetical protein
MSIQLKEWAIQWGETRILVTSEMVADALQKAVSVMTKEYTKANRVIIEDPRMRAEWEQATMILDLARHNFLALDDMEQRGQVRAKIPGKVPGGKPN